jgi:hypothetical protein
LIHRFAGVALPTLKQCRPITTPTAIESEKFRACCCVSKMVLDALAKRLIPGHQRVIQIK